MNNKGFSLLEVLMALVISGFIFWATTTGIVGQIKVLRKVQNIQTNLQLPVAISPGADKRIYVSNLNECVSLQTGPWHAKRQDSRVVGFYQSSDCITGYLGTLNATNNPSYDDTVTNTWWQVSGQDEALRVLVRILNLPK